MSINKLNIAKTLRVGFNKRHDTYTGMLAYIIYYDEKNVLRKEKSWNSWIDKSIEPQEFPNEPTSGFVLNKKVGDYRSDWNHRSAAVRVYDPRGFEFEISVENLLYILQECTSTKGKGLEGEFVYAWDGSNLVLLPTSSVEYEASKVFTDHKSSKVTKGDMVAGCVYLNKDMNNVLYLGREDYYEIHTAYKSEGGKTISQVNKGKKHIFVYTDSGREGSLWVQTGFTKIASKLSDTIATNFAEEYENFKQSFEGSPVTKITFEECKPEINSAYGYRTLQYLYYMVVIKDGKYYGVNGDRVYDDDTVEFYCRQEYIINDCTLHCKKYENGGYYGYYGPSKNKQRIALNHLKLYRPTLHNEYGKTKTIS